MKRALELRTESGKAWGEGGRGRGERGGKVTLESASRMHHRSCVYAAAHVKRLWRQPTNSPPRGRSRPSGHPPEPVKRLVALTGTRGGPRPVRARQTTWQGQGLWGTYGSGNALEFPLNRKLFDEVVMDLIFWVIWLMLMFLIHGVWVFGWHTDDMS